MRLLFHAWKNILRIVANHVLSNSLRIILFRASGVMIGKKVFINRELTITDNGERGMIMLKDYTILSPNVTFIAMSYPNCVHPSLNVEDLPLKKEKIIVEEGVWIGANATILPGITLGKCSIIGAGSVVTKDIPAYSIAAGVPAKVLRRVKK